MPLYISYNATLNLMTKISGAYTNVAGPRQPLIMNGYRTNRLFYIPTQFGLDTCGISFISHNGVMKMAFTCDSTVDENPQLMVDIFEKNFIKHIEQPPTP
jgi:hypothetical protein